MDGVIKLCEDLQVGEGTPPAYVRGGSVSLPRTHKHSNTLCACVRCSPTEDVVMLVIAWLLKAAKMAEFTKVRCHDMIPWVRMRWRTVALLLWQYHRCWGSDRSGILCVCVCVCVCVCPVRIRLSVRTKRVPMLCVCSTAGGVDVRVFRSRNRVA